MCFRDERRSLVNNDLLGVFSGYKNNICIFLFVAILECDIDPPTCQIRHPTSKVKESIYPILHQTRLKTFSKS